MAVGRLLSYIGTTAVMYVDIVSIGQEIRCIISNVMGLKNNP